MAGNGFAVFASVCAYFDENDAFYTSYTTRHTSLIFSCILLEAALRQLAAKHSAAADDGRSIKQLEDENILLKKVKRVHGFIL
jgi:hypothetical protein